jgi:hypothetical protein
MPEAWIEWLWESSSWQMVGVAMPRNPTPKEGRTQNTTRSTHFYQQTVFAE